jgi:KTSC domain
MPSTVIRSFRYDALTRDLFILFQSGRAYVYKDVPAEIFAAMKASFSKGEFFNAHIRDRFRFTRESGGGGKME